MDKGCIHADLAPGASCRLSVIFTPDWVGNASALLTVSGDGTPLLTALRATAYALPAVTSIAAPRCLEAGSRGAIQVLTNQRSSLSWDAVFKHTVGGPLCPAIAAGGRSSATGQTTTSSRPRPKHYVARLALPLTGRRGLHPGSYLLTVTPANAHGAGPPRTTLLTVG